MASSATACGRCATSAPKGLGIMARGNRHRHGEANPQSVEYRTWASMKRRCNNPHTNNYCRYGALGVTVCERWNDYSNFLADMGRRPTPQHSLDRLKGRKVYCKRNCRWATPTEQNNNKSNVRVARARASEIRQAHAADPGWGTYSRLARRFGLCKQQIRRIVLHEQCDGGL